jgi:hypothetical protein
MFAAICFTFTYDIKAKDFRKDIYKHSELLKGNLLQGYGKTSNPFAKNLIKLTWYSPNNTEDCPVCLYIADKYINIHYAQPLLTTLAKKGIKVAAFEFSDNHRLYTKAFFNRVSLYKNPELETDTEELYISQAKAALIALKSTDKVFVLADGGFKKTWKNLEAEYSQMIESVYDINSDGETIYGYKDGFANFIQLNPVECLFLKIKPCRDKLMNELIASKAVKKFGIQKKENQPQKEISETTEALKNDIISD